MARSRYSNNDVVDGFFYGSWQNPALEGTREVDMLEGVRTIDYTVKQGDRLDHLAAIHYGDDQYYWVIALANNIVNPLKLVLGQKLKIPVDFRNILDKVLR